MMNTIEFRTGESFLRNMYVGEGLWEIPMIVKQPLDLSHIELIACSDTSKCDTKNLHKGVHFFTDDYRFESIYAHPERTLEKYGRYRFLLSPDFSLYREMPPWRQIESVGKARWVGAFWQSKGLTVIPTVSWGAPNSFRYCFDGIEKGAIVAVGMIGCKRERIPFMKGYQAMQERIKPSAVICFGEPFPEMKGNIIPVDYLSSRRVERDGR